MAAQHAVSKRCVNFTFISSQFWERPWLKLALGALWYYEGTAQARKSPLLAAQIIRALTTMPTDLVGLRDRALLLVGFSGAFRRSELVALDVADVEVGEDGLTVTLRRSKNDPGA